MVFVFYLFTPAPVLFRPLELSRVAGKAEFRPIQREYDAAHERRRQAALALAQSHRDGRSEESDLTAYRAAQRQIDDARSRAARLVERNGGEQGFNDTNYIFLSFVTAYLPTGIVGLVIAVVFAATMSASSGEINSLATVSVVDIYKRYVRRGASDHHYLVASRWCTLFWGFYAVAFAGFAARLGSLIEAVNRVGSLFYGTLLGCFVLALGFRRVRGTATFVGMLVGEAAILATSWYSSISWLWYSLIGAAVVVAVALLITAVSSEATSAMPDIPRPPQPPRS
jgi:Na+(H+)/acetate symporter ActP